MQLELQRERSIVSQKDEDILQIQSNMLQKLQEQAEQLKREHKVNKVLAKLRKQLVKENTDLKGQIRRMQVTNVRKMSA